MFVYSFWEPRDSMPAYLQLCMETWKKNLPNATIVFLDYKNIGEFIDIHEIGLSMFYRNIPMSHVADAIRVALLAKHGGVWLDCDIIILNPEAEKYFLPDEDHNTVLFGYPQGRSSGIGFINSPPGAMCMKLWNQYIKEKLWKLKSSTNISWDFFGNSFIDNYARKYLNEIKILDNNPIRPEKKFISNSKPWTEAWQEAYAKFYFFENHHLKDINAEMLILTNSWTPPAFKKLSREEVLRCDCTVTNILAETLEIKLPPHNERFRFSDLLKK